VRIVWDSRILGDVCEYLNRGIAPKYTNEGGIAVLNQKCVRGHAVDFGQARRHDSALKSVHRDKLVRKGDVLINSTGTGTLGRVAPVRAEPAEPTTADSHVTIVRPREGLFVPEFFGYSLVSIEGKIKESGEGCGGQTELARSKLANGFEIRFPSDLAEQQRIATILDEAFAGITTAKANAEKNLRNAQDLLGSHLAKLFGNRKTGWVQTTIGNCVRFIDYRGRTPNKTLKGLRLITAKNVKMGFLQRDPMEFVDPSTYSGWMTRGIPRKGDVLFTTEAPLGNVAQLDTDEKVVFAQRVIIMQPASDVLDSTFLKYLLLSPLIQQRIQDKATGATALGIKASLLRTVRIEFPEQLREQKRLVESLDTLRSDSLRLVDVYRKKLAALDALQQSLLTRAFAGEL
jgi:type I restriction enzyme S subunit